MTQRKHELEGDTSVVERIKVKVPRNFQVMLLNDDYTTMEFVVMILEKVFKKTPAEAMQLMLRVHRNGAAVAGVYTREIAEAKVERVHSLAQSAGFPLKCTLEEA